MKPAPFKYVAALSLDHALSLKAEYGDEARFIAGGQSLIPAMNFRLARPAVLIDINGLAELAGIDRTQPGTVRIGAMTRYRDLERDGAFLASCPLFADALPHIAHPQIRNRGTIGGNLCHADPASEFPAVVTATEGRMRLRSTSGERELAASDFFTGLLTTEIRADEMLIDITLPVGRPRTGVSFQEIARRRGDFALAGVAAIVSLDEARCCTDIRLALCGVGETPVDASAAASSLVGTPGGAATIKAAAADIGKAITPSGYVQASAAYQHHVAGILAERTIAAAFERARHAA
ncbi:MAG: xanthine dehydrogenase family protein subunit M [Pseudomonadota bacterium]|jgi:carbon-monoxide dehydrogenase medium subunit